MVEEWQASIDVQETTETRKRKHFETAIPPMADDVDTDHVEMTDELDPINTTITIRKGRNEGNVDDSYVNDDSKKAPAAAAAAPLLDNNELNHNDLSTGARGGKSNSKKEKSLPVQVKRQLEVGKIDTEAKKVRLQERKEKTAAEQLLLERNQKVSQKLLEPTQISPKSQLNEMVTTLMQGQVKVTETLEQLSSRMDAIVEMATCQRCVKALYKDCLKRNVAPLTSVKSGTIPAYMSPVSHSSPSPSMRPVVQPSPSNAPVVVQPSTPTVVKQPTIVDVDRSSNKESDSITDEDISSAVVDDQQAGTSCTNGTSNIGSDLVYLGEARFGITVQKDHLHSARVTSKDGVKYALNLIEFIVTRTECQDKLTVSGEGRGTKPMDFHKVEALKSEIFSQFHVTESKEKQKQIWKMDIMPSLNNKIRGIRNGKYPGVSD